MVSGQELTEWYHQSRLSLSYWEKKIMANKALFKKFNVKVILDKHQPWTPALNLHSHTGQSGWLLLGLTVTGLRGFRCNYSWSKKYDILSRCAFTHNFSRRRKWNSRAMVATKFRHRQRVLGFDVCLILLRLSSFAPVILNIEFSTTSVANILREVVSHFWKKKLWEGSRQKGLQFASESYIQVIICRQSILNK